MSLCLCVPYISHSHGHSHGHPPSCDSFKGPSRHLSQYQAIVATNSEGIPENSWKAAKTDLYLHQKQRANENLKFTGAQKKKLNNKIISNMEKKYLFSSVSDLASKMSRAAGQVWQGVLELNKYTNSPYWYVDVNAKD